MLFILHQANHAELQYRGGQGPIIHLESDMRQAVAWAEAQPLRWAFTLSNAGAYYCEHRRNLGQLDEIDWRAVQATDWRGLKEGKQAEFLVEQRFPWELVSQVGVMSQDVHARVCAAIGAAAHRPRVEIRREWYY